MGKRIKDCFPQVDMKQIGRIGLLCLIMLACWQELRQRLRQAAGDQPVVDYKSAVFIDSLVVTGGTLYFTAVDQQAYEQLKSSLATVLPRRAAGTESCTDTACGKVFREGTTLVLETMRHKQVRFVNEEMHTGAIPKNYVFETSLNTMHYWLVSCTMSDYSDWILVSHTTGEVSVVMAGAAISPSGRYLLAASCGGEGAACNDAKLYWYENTGTRVFGRDTLPLMPGKGWMPEDIKWISDSSFIARLVPEEGEAGHPLRHDVVLPAFVKAVFRSSH
jgi:hypothetical protein